MVYQTSVVRDEYISYVRLEKNYSANTVLEYENDVNEFLAFLQIEGITDLNEVTYPEARLYVTGLYDKGLARATISRKISSIRSFFKFANSRYSINDSAFRLLHHPKKEERLPAFFMKKNWNSCLTPSKEMTKNHYVIMRYSNYFMQLEFE